VLPAGRKSGNARRRLSNRAAGARAERRAAWWYRLRGWRILATNVWIGGYELDLIVRRGRQVSFVEVKAKSGTRFGDPLEMVTPEKQRRVRRAATAWLAAHREVADCVVRFDVFVARGSAVDCITDAF
jgi:putative endonuclease